MKYLYTLLLSLSSLCWLHAQSTSIADVWKSIPQQIVPTIDSLSRLDMCDLYAAGMVAQAKTLWGDTAQITFMGDSYISVRTSKASTMQIKIVGKGRNTLYAVITTTYGPAANSHISFYDNKWQPLAAKKHFTPLTVADFINLPAKEKKQRKDVANKIEIQTITYQMCNENDNIIAHPTFMECVDKDTRSQIETLIYPSRTMERKGRKWKVVKIDPNKAP